MYAELIIVAAVLLAAWYFYHRNQTTPTAVIVPITTSQIRNSLEKYKTWESPYAKYDFSETELGSTLSFTAAPANGPAIKVVQPWEQVGNNTLRLPMGGSLSWVNDKAMDMKTVTEEDRLLQVRIVAAEPK